MEGEEETEKQGDLPGNNANIAVRSETRALPADVLDIVEEGGDKLDNLLENASRLGEDDETVPECQAPQIIIGESGKPFGKHCSKKVKGNLKLLIEGRISTDGALSVIPLFDNPLSVNLCALHGEKYTERVKDMVCGLPSCYGRGFTCAYQEKIFRFCHLHMAGALENEVEMTYKLQSATPAPIVNAWEDEGLWKDSQITLEKCNSNGQGGGGNDMGNTFEKDDVECAKRKKPFDFDCPPKGKPE